MNIKNKSVLKEIKKFRKKLEGSDINNSELEMIIKINYIYNQQYRFIKLSPNHYYDRFQKKYYFYTKPKNTPKNYKIKGMYVRRMYKTMLHKKRVEQYKLDHYNDYVVDGNFYEEVAEWEANDVIHDLETRFSFNQLISQFGS